MITLKTGVPGSGKTLSMVAELLANSKLAEQRPVYTNIDGLAIPHIKLSNLEPDTKRIDGVMYTTDWRQCPPGSIIVIDEAFLYGYDAKSAQSQVPDYIRDLAVHRKDYSVDIWFIAQHPKLLHVALRRQVGKHQHYRRLFGWGRAVCYEWDMAQDQLSQTKTAVTTQFSYPKDVFKAYKSAQQHNKPKFKLPWWAWLPVALVPAAVWAFPAAYSTLSGAMTGKGLPPSAQVAAQKAPENKNQDLLALSVAPPPVAPSPLLPQALSAQPNPVAKPDIAGCIHVGPRCGCFDGSGKPVEVEPMFCESKTGQGQGEPVKLAETESRVTPQDVEVLEFMRQQRSKRSAY